MTLLKPKRRTYVLAIILGFIGVSLLLAIPKQTNTISQAMIGSIISIHILGGIGLFQKMKIAWWVLVVFFSIAFPFYLLEGVPILYSSLVQGNSIGIFHLSKLIIPIVYTLSGLLILISDRPKNWLIQK